MTYKIDWFSFTTGSVSLKTLVGQGALGHLEAIPDYLSLLINLDCYPDMPFIPTNPIPMYPYGLQHVESGICFRWGEVNDHIKVDCSGKSCDYLHEHNHLIDALRTYGDRASRVDIAIDVETDALPETWVAQLTLKRTPVVSTINSQSGQTVYIGSRKSERMCRVYRYYEPHPRSETLRVEVELKKNLARTFCSRLVNETIDGVIYGELLPYMVQPENWLEVEGEYEQTHHVLEKREHSDKLAWLERQVVPSLRELRDEGFPIFTWLAERVYPGTDWTPL